MHENYGRIVLSRKTTTNKNKQTTTSKNKQTNNNKLINSFLCNLLFVLPRKWSPLGLGQVNDNYHVSAFFPGSLFVTVIAVVGFCLAIRAKKRVKKCINK